MQRHRSHVNVHYVASTTFTLDSGYSDLKPIGRGSYGVVCSAFSAKHDSKVAIKKITPVSANTMDIKHVLREIKLMRHMGKHENIITLMDLILREASDELYIVMELMDSDLHRIIQSKQQLTDGHFKHFFFQLMCGVKYLHDNKIIHRDLKPGNLLVGKDCRLRITDFGLAREKPDNIEDGPMTEHVVTRWYRSPELMLCPDGLYSYPVDIWSCGCILAEMLGRNPLFPGKTFIHQLSLIFDVIGSPAPGDVTHIVNSEALAFLQSQRGKRKVAFSTLYPKAESSAWQILEDTLGFVPSRRPTADEILRSPYLHGTGTAASLEFPRVSADFCFPFENAELSKSELKRLLFDEITSFRRERSGRSTARKDESTPLASTSTSDRHAGTSSTADAGEEAAQRERRRKSTGSTTRAGLISKTRRAEAKDDAPQAPPPAAGPGPGPWEANLPRYLRPTGHIRDRYVSAPRLRPAAPAGTGAGEDRAAVKKGGTSSGHRAEDKDHDDMASANSGSVAGGRRPTIKADLSLTAPKPTVVADARQLPDRRDAKEEDGDETPRVSAEFLPGTMTARPITAGGTRNTTQPRINPISPERRRPDATQSGADSEIRASTMRNLISMCDELYRDDGGGEGGNPNAAGQVSEAKEEPRSEQQHPRRYVDHKDIAEYPPHSRAIAPSADGNEYKGEGSADLFSPQARTQPPTRMTALRPHHSEEKASPGSYAQRGLRRPTVGAKDQDEDSDNEVPVARPAPVPASAPVRAAASAVAEPKGGWAKPMQAAYKSVSYDSDPEPALEARGERSPASTLRKSLLQTYTSPTRLKSTHPSESPMQRSPGPGHSGKVPNRDRGSDPTVLSLAERLQERARLVDSAYTSTEANDDEDDQMSSHAHQTKSGSGDALHRRDDGAVRKPEVLVNSDYGANYQNQHQGQGMGQGSEGTTGEDHAEGSADGKDGAPTQPAARPRKFTVAKSPKFSLMSWQKRREEQRETEARQAAQLLEESKQRRKSGGGGGGGGGLGKTAKPGAAGNFFGHEPPKRSDSAPRHRR